jgi:hypothetical protein
MAALTTVIIPDCPSVIHVADGLDGDGTARSPWILTREDMFRAVRQLSWTRKTIFFCGGLYLCPEPIEINFADLFPLSISDDESMDRDPNFEMLRDGVRFIGEGRASILRFSQADTDSIQFHIHWTATKEGRSPRRQAALFFWEFTGLYIEGRCNTALVQFGGGTVEDCAWNSCVFDLAVNNAFDSSAFDDGFGTARAVVLKRVLQSRVELVSVCHSGVACVMDTCEFSTINGSFMNGIVPDPSVARGKSISKDGIGLYLVHCTANGSTSINFDSAYEGLRITGRTRGNAFGSITSSNCDMRGCVINDERAELGMRNMVQCVVRQDVCQQDNTWQPLYTPQSKGCVAVLHGIATDIIRAELGRASGTSMPSHGTEDAGSLLTPTSARPQIPAARSPVAPSAAT